MTRDISEYKQQFTENLKEIKADKGHLLHDDVERLRVAWLGRKGILPELFSQLKTVAREDKASMGKELNLLKVFCEQQIKELQERARQQQIRHLLSHSSIDVTLPVADQHRVGSLHPVSLINHKLQSIFRRLGYHVFDGPEVEVDYYNFRALNIHENHPARDMQDTFYLKDRLSDETKDATNATKWVMRTQTSNVQIHVMENFRPPFTVVAPGKVFRVDSDPTHTPIFHQIEGLHVDKNVSLADLKGTIQVFLSELLGYHVAMRLRPSYFPFVEPGLEIDIALPSKEDEQLSWLEVGGCGMVHPHVFEMVGVDSEEYMGFAFGFGIDRLAMIHFNLHDLRHFFSGDVQWLSQFPSFLGTPGSGLSSVCHRN
ncbi:MAG: phenylalanine--tRNA ligase subunit alpha [Proteobacteria bacterium]|nr:phenylalanine--tRNA ligase subunit alpha [Pseudomonadota bacterium]